jgi:hypothetical protein
LKVNEIGEKIKKTYKNRHFNTVNSEKEWIYCIKLKKL